MVLTLGVLLRGFFISRTSPASDPGKFVWQVPEAGRPAFSGGTCLALVLQCQYIFTRACPRCSRCSRSPQKDVPLVPDVPVVPGIQDIVWQTYYICHTTIWSVADGETN